MANIFHIFSPRGLSEKLQALDESRPKAYRAVAVIFTLGGYFLISLFPLLFIFAVLTLLSRISNADSWQVWLSALIWLAVTGLAGLMTFLILRLHVSSPSGLGLKPDKGPKLYEMLDELQAIYKHPKIHRVVLHDQYSIEFIPVPRFGLPLLTVNTLYIGLPVMQGLSAPQFKAMVARRLGQYSMQHNRAIHWVYRFRQYLALYQHAYDKQSREQWFYLPFKWFFYLYVPLFNAVSVHAARRDELEADVYALEVMNDEEFADTLIRYSVVEHFLQEKYWPKIHALLRKNPIQPEFLPHASMHKVLRNGLTDHEVASSLERLIKQEPNWHEGLPSLHQRLNNMSFRNLSLPPPVLESAAQRVLGSTQAAVIKLMDQQWLAKQGIKTKKNRDAEPPKARDNTGEDSDQVLYTQLKAKAESEAISDDELWQFAGLTEKRHGKAAAIALYQKILTRNTQHAKTWFAIGRILLTQNDTTGIKALERAMELDSGCCAQAYWMLAKFYKAHGEEKLAKACIAKAAQFNSNAAA